jgi:uncharacterized protein YgiM (DUF1202 family)
MKKILLTILVLALASLACLSTGSAAIESPAPEQVTTRLVAIEETSEPATVAEPTQTSTPILCAVVVAAEAQNLRNAPSVDAGILTWLNAGEVVQVVDDSNPDWWHVRSAKAEGFARSIFLVNAECVK